MTNAESQQKGRRAKINILLLRLLSLFSKNLLCSYQRDPSGVLRCQGTDLALIYNSSLNGS